MYSPSTSLQRRAASSTLSASSSSRTSSFLLPRLPSLLNSTSTLTRSTSLSSSSQRRSYSRLPPSHSQRQSLFAVGQSRSLILPPSTISQLTKIVSARTFASSTPPSSSTNTPAKSDENASSTSKDVAPAASSKEVAAPKKTTWEKVKHEAKHYWESSKLLAHEVRISWKIQKKVLKGGSLTRREQRQLKRTTVDLLRLLPFSVFVIIPGLELLLPVFLKFFPNMLPSTFEDKFAAEEKQRKLLRVRINMAKFLQETISESGLKANDVVKSDEFKQFFRKVRSTGESPSKEDIIKVAQLFKSDVTLDNLSRPQIVSVCRYMKIHAFGTDNFMRHQIRNRLDQIRKDDAVILEEGVDSLSVSELQMACQSRGVRFSGVSPSALRRELASWIDLHYTNKISGVLLVLSRAFHFNEEGADVIKSLESTLASLPDNLLSEAELDVLGPEASFQEKMEVLQQQQDLIEEEAVQEKEEESARKEAKELEERLKAEEKARKDEERALREKEVEVEAEPVDDARMTKEQVQELAEALSILSAKSSIVKERNELKTLMEENIASEQVHKIDTSLSKRIRSMLTKIDAQLEAYDAKVGGSLKMIEVDGQGKISLADLEKAFGTIKHKPDEEKMALILEKLDTDHDGFVVLEHVMALTQDYGLGVVIDDTAKSILGQGADLKKAPVVDSK
ncbi:LETM1-like protein-domain-containing protein [Mrakia frigida]|uniref:LETM1-like protein-domain-containing protein n=1 Tax=Mrakia frigida TaxID=29902 RepID=UPI003FCC0FB1